MGHVEVNVGLSNPNTGAKTDEKGLVDTGATLSVLPRNVAEFLRLPVKSRSKAVTAGGPVSVDLSDVSVEISLGRQLL